MEGESDGEMTAVRKSEGEEENGRDKFNHGSASDFNPSIRLTE